MNLLKPREAALRLGVSYPTLKQWIYQRKLKTIKTSGGHHRIPQAELDRYLHLPKDKPMHGRESYRRISGRNQLVGRVTEIKTSGLMAQVKLSIGGQVVTSIITADAITEMNLKVGDTAAALVKSTEVMIVRP